MSVVTQGPVGIPHRRLSLSLSSWHLSHTWMYCMGGIKTDCGINEGWGSTSRIQALAGSLKSWCDGVARLCADVILCLHWLWRFTRRYGEMRVTLAALESKFSMSLSLCNFRSTWFSLKGEDVLRLSTSYKWNEREDGKCTDFYDVWMDLSVF